MPGLAVYVGLVHQAEQTLAEAFRTVGEGHSQHPDVLFACTALAQMSEEHVRRLAPIAERYGEEREAGDVREPERLHASELTGTRSGPLGLLRDLQDLHLLATLVQTSWTVIAQAAQGLRDDDLLEVTTAASGETARQLSWLVTHLKTAAPQALIVAT